jgi:TPP-dependent indolepyruvate ferredoxin oxidoreductase alpha subunit
MSELSEILEKLTVQGVHLENIKEDISEMKTERENHKEKFWKNINKMHDDIHKEETARISGDNDIEKDVTKIKTKVGIIAAGLSTGITILIFTIKGMFKNGGS